jgi:hypothetical protein
MPSTRSTVSGAFFVHVLRVHVDDELAVAAERVLARLDVVRRRHGERPAR